MDQDDFRPLVGGRSRGSLLEEDVGHDSVVMQRGNARARVFSTPLMPNYRDQASVLRRDFTTIDWAFQRYQDKVKAKAVRDARADFPRWKRNVLNVYDNLETFFVLMLVGVATALSAYFIHVITDFLQGFRLGYCHSGFFVSHALCCVDQGRDCAAWQTWGESAFGSDDGGGSQFFNFIIFTFWAVVYAFGGAYLVDFYQQYATGSGLPYLKTILGGFIIKGFLGARTLVIKSFALVLTVASGLHLGKEGPIIHIAACWANVFARKFERFRTNDVKRREIYTAAVSAGVAAAFGAPIGGVIFGIEALSSYFDRRIMWQALSCAVVCIVLLVALNPFENGTLVQFQVVQSHGWHWVECLPFALIGISGGALGALYIKMYSKIQTLRQSLIQLRLHPIYEVGIFAGLTAVVSFWNPYMKDSTVSLLSMLFNECSDYNVQELESSVGSALCARTSVPGNMSLLIIAGLLRLTFSVSSVGLKVPGGMFIPLMASGACMGRAVGWIVQLIQEDIGDEGFFEACKSSVNCISPSLYAILGAASLLSGVQRFVVAISVIILELTGGLDYMTPVMIAVMFSKIAGDYLHTMNIVDIMVHTKGFPYIHADDVEEALLGDAVAGDLMSSELASVHATRETVVSLRAMLTRHPWHGFPVVDDEKLLIGFLSRANLESALRTREGSLSSVARCVFVASLPADEKVDVYDENKRDETVLSPRSNSPSSSSTSDMQWLREFIDPFPVRVMPDTPAIRVLDMFKSLGLRYVVVCSVSGRVLGIIKKKDLILAQHQIVRGD